MSALTQSGHRPSMDTSTKRLQELSCHAAEPAHNLVHAVGMVVNPVPQVPGRLTEWHTHKVGDFLQPLRICGDAEILPDNFDRSEGDYLTLAHCIRCCFNGNVADQRVDQKLSPEEGLKYTGNKEKDQRAKVTA